MVICEDPPMPLAIAVEEKDQSILILIIPRPGRVHEVFGLIILILYVLLQNKIRFYLHAK